MSWDLGVALQGAKLPERLVPVCFNGQLIEALHAAERALRDELESTAQDVTYELAKLRDEADKAQIEVRGGALVNAAGTRIRDAEAIVNGAQQAVRDAQLSFRMRALPPHEITTLRAAHPPREGDKEDERAGVNLDTYLPELTRRSLIDPKPTAEQWKQLVGDGTEDGHGLHYAEFKRLVAAAEELSHREGTMTPFSFGASAQTPASGAKPKKRAG